MNWKIHQLVSYSGTQFSQYIYIKFSIIEKLLSPHKGSHQKKPGYFTVRLTVRGEGRSAPSALTVSKCENFDIFSLKFDSLTLKTYLISL